MLVLLTPCVGKRECVFCDVFFCCWGLPNFVLQLCLLNYGFMAYYRGRERMAREPGVALLMIASGSKIKQNILTCFNPSIYFPLLMSCSGLQLAAGAIVHYFNWIIIAYVGRCWVNR